LVNSRFKALKAAFEVIEGEMPNPWAPFMQQRLMLKSGGPVFHVGLDVEPARFLEHLQAPDGHEKENQCDQEEIRVTKGDA